MSLEGKSFVPKHSLLSGCSVLSAHGLRGCCMKQCLVTRPLRGGSQRCRHLHTLPHGRPSQILAFPPASASNLKQARALGAGSARMLGLCCPPPGQLGLSVRKRQSPKPDTLWSTALAIFGVPVQMDFRANLCSICSLLPWTEVLQWHSFVACAPFVPE